MQMRCIFMSRINDKVHARGEMKWSDKMLEYSYCVLCVHSTHSSTLNSSNFKWRYVSNDVIHENILYFNRIHLQRGQRGHRWHRFGNIFFLHFNFKVELITFEGRKQKCKICDFLITRQILETINRPIRRQKSEQISCLINAFASDYNYTATPNVFDLFFAAFGRF